MKVNTTREELITSAALLDGVEEKHGVLFTWTGAHTGRSPNAKRYELDETSEGLIDWKTNVPISTSEFDEYRALFATFYCKNSQDLYYEKVAAVRDPRRRMNVNIYTELPQHALFAKNMFTERIEGEAKFAEYDVFHFPSLLPEPTVLISLSRKLVLISGTYYSGEIKKSIFSILNIEFPVSERALPMHCSVNVDKNRENPAVFFGLSGTGKTTLSSDPNRILIGDDEHAWTDAGLTNFEGGCYAKTLNLSATDEPEIFNACSVSGTILENVVVADGVPDFSNDRYTKNGRASYSVESIPGSDVAGYVDLHPKNIVMLTCDAFGVLPPVAKLSSEEAIEHFALGYTAKVAGTESGVAEPMATFSPCFGGPFMPLPISEYKNILKGKIEKHEVDCWLVNTGWTGGPFGIGDRIPIKTTRMVIDSILDGTLSDSETALHEYTGLSVPLHKGIDKDVLFPENGWENLEEYKSKVEHLNKLFDDRRKELLNG